MVGKLVGVDTLGAADRILWFIWFPQGLRSGLWRTMFPKDLAQQETTGSLPLPSPLAAWKNIH